MGKGTCVTLGKRKAPMKFTISLGLFIWGLYVYSAYCCRLCAARRIVLTEIRLTLEKFFHLK